MGLGAFDDGPAARSVYQTRRRARVTNAPRAYAGRRMPSRPWLGAALAALACGLATRCTPRERAKGDLAHDVARADASASASPAIAAIAAASRLTCALSANHAVRCWEPSNPRPREELFRATRSLYMSHSDLCVTTTGGQVICQAIDRVGAPSAAIPLSPVEILSLASGPRETIAYALLRTGGVVAFRPRDEPRPVTIEGLRGVTVLGAGGRACAVTVDRRAVCWSHAEVQEAMDAGKPTAQPHLVPVPALDGARALGDGVAITTAGRLVEWDAHVVRGAPDLHDVGVEGARRFAGAGRTLCALIAGGRVTCRGGEGFVPVAGIEGAVDLAVGDGRGCAVREGGDVWCWVGGAAPRRMP